MLIYFKKVIVLKVLDLCRRWDSCVWCEVCKMLLLNMGQMYNDLILYELEYLFKLENNWTIKTVYIELKAEKSFCPYCS